MMPRATTSKLSDPLRFASFLLLILFGCWIAYDQLSTVFTFYDDEGYMLLSLRNYLRGKILYDQVLAQYGPFFYMLQRAIYGLLNAPINHDGGRVVTLVYWLGAAGAGSAMIFRYSRNLILTAAAFIAISGCEKGLANEPGHPQQVIVLLLMVAGLVTTWTRNGRQSTLGLFILGAIGAALLLTKINVGLFYSIALLAALLTFSASPSQRRMIWTAGGVLYASLPVVLMHAHWQGFRDVALLLLIGGVILAFVSARLSGPPALSGKAWASPLVGGLLTGLAVLAIAIAQGVSFNGLWDGAFMAPFRHPGVFWEPFVWTRLGQFICFPAFIVGLLATANFPVLHQRRYHIPLVQVIAGCGIILALFAGVRAAVLCAALLFPLTIFNRGPEQRPENRFTAFLVTHIALLQLLQLYPVPGSQVRVAATVIVAWAFLLVADGTYALRTEGSDELRLGLATRLPWVLVLLLIVTQLWSVTREAKLFPKVPSDLPGSTWIHLPAEQAAVYRWMALNLPKHCDTLFSMPGMGSLNIWSGVPEPSSIFMTAWMSGFSLAQKQIVTAALRSHLHPCVVSNPLIAGIWTAHVQTSADDPLSAYIRDDLQVGAEAAGYQVRVPISPAPQWNEDQILTSPRELTGDAIGLPEGLFQPAAKSLLRFQVRSGARGLSIRSTCLPKSAIPCLSIQSDALTLRSGTNASITSALDLRDRKWHSVEIRNDASAWTASADGNVVARIKVDASWDQSPAYLLSGSGMLQDFVLSRER